MWREFERYGRDYSEDGLKFIEEIITMGDLGWADWVITICGEFTECSMQTFVSDWSGARKT